MYTIYVYNHIYTYHSRYILYIVNVLNVKTSKMRIVNNGRNVSMIEISIEIPMPPKPTPTANDIIQEYASGLPNEIAPLNIRHVSTCVSRTHIIMLSCFFFSFSKNIVRL